MAMNRTQFVTEICDVVGKRITASAVSGTTLESRVQKYLNWAQARIARFYSFHELNVLKTTCATVDGVKRYPLTAGTSNLGLTRPKDISSIRLIDGEYSRKLIRWSTRKFDTKYPRPENFATGRPSLYMRDGDNIEFFKVPGDAYTLYIRYPQWAVDLTSDTQVSDFKDKDQLIITAGVFETYFALEEYGDAKIWYARFLGQLTDAVRASGDIDWEPQASPGDDEGYKSGVPWADPYGGPGDPLYGYGE